MKISIIGKLNQLRWVEHLSDAYIRLGHEINIIAVNDLGVFTDLKRNFFKLFDRSKAAGVNLLEINNLLDKQKPDLIIVISPFFLPSQLSDIINNKKVPAVAWLGDRYNPNPDRLEQLSVYTKLYFSDTGVMELCRDLLSKSHYLPLAFNDLVFNPAQGVRKNKIIFIGASTHNRNTFFENLSDDLPLKLIGNRWKKRLHQEAAKRIQIVDRNIALKKVVHEYQSNLFVLNILSDSNVIHGMNARTFEAMACGSCVIQDDLSDARNTFNHLEHLLFYKQPDDIKPLWQEMINNPDRLSQIQKNASEIVHDSHTYVHRARYILDTI